MQTALKTEIYSDRKIWFSMWFLGAIVTFGIAFFPMFYRLVEGRNKHFQNEAIFEQHITNFSKNKEKAKTVYFQPVKERNAKLWAASIIFIVPAFIIIFLLSRDLAIHEQKQDSYLASELPRRVFMPQTIPLTSYVLITIVTLGVGIVYWLYKITNLYNAHYKAHLAIEKEISLLAEEQSNVKHM